MLFIIKELQISTVDDPDLELKVDELVDRPQKNKREKNSSADHE
jgi:hypothetical protein